MQLSNLGSPSSTRAVFRRNRVDSSASVLSIVTQLQGSEKEKENGKEGELEGISEDTKDEGEDNRVPGAWA